MSTAHRLARYGAARLSRRVARSIPVLGAAIALLALGSSVRRKGVVAGTVDTGLNATPFVGAFKTLIEWFRGRDLIGDRAR